MSFGRDLRLIGWAMERAAPQQDHAAKRHPIRAWGQRSVAPGHTSPQACPDGVPHRRINAVNLRKAFFQVSLDEIKAVDDDVDFRLTALAEEYYESQRLMGAAMGDGEEVEEVVAVGKKVVPRGKLSRKHAK